MLSWSRMAASSARRTGREALWESYPAPALDGERDVAVPLLPAAVDGCILFVPTADLRCIARAAADPHCGERRSICSRRRRLGPRRAGSKRCAARELNGGLGVGWGGVEPGK